MIRLTCNDSIVKRTAQARPLSSVQSRSWSRIVLRHIPLLAGIWLILNPFPSVAAQSNNLHRIQECARILSDSLLSPAPDDQDLCTRIIEHPADWVIDQAVLTTAQQKKLRITPCAPPYRNEILIAITSIGITYTETDDSDVLQRDATVAVSASLPDWIASGSGNIPRITRSLEVVLTDTVDADQTSLLEDPGYAFTTGTRIRQASSGGFWDNVVEPAIVLGTSVVMVILLFSVRSQ